MKSDEGEHRREKRIDYHFVLRARPLGSSQQTPWDMSTVRNISKTGVLFYSSAYYDYGSEIELRIMNPMLLKEIVCVGKIVRCSLLDNIQNMYSIAVRFIKVDEEGQDALDKTIKFLSR